MSNGPKVILYVALVIQLIGFGTLIISDASGLANDIALCAVIGAGLIEVVLGLLAYRQQNVFND